MFAKRILFGLGVLIIGAWISCQTDTDTPVESNEESLGKALATGFSGKVVSIVSGKTPESFWARYTADEAFRNDYESKYGHLPMTVTQERWTLKVTFQFDSETFSKLGNLRIQVNDTVRPVDASGRFSMPAITQTGTEPHISLLGTIDGVETELGNGNPLVLSLQKDGSVDVELLVANKTHGCCVIQAGGSSNHDDARESAKTLHANDCMDYNGWGNDNENCTQPSPDPHENFWFSDCFHSLYTFPQVCAPSLIHSWLAYCKGYPFTHRCSSLIGHSTSPHCH